MGFFEWLKGQFVGKEKIEITPETVEKYIDSEKMNRLALEELTIHAAINMIAGCVSKCEFQTFLNGSEKQGEEYYLWNYEPNRNQNANQFKQELVTRLLYNNECLVIESGGQLIIAESFTKEEYAIRETIFHNVTRTGFTFERSFRMSEVLYFRLNNKNIRNLLESLCSGYDKLLSEAVDKYEKAGGEKGTLHIDAKANGMKFGNRSFEEVFEDLMNNRFKKFFNSRSAVLPLFDGFTYTKQAAEQSKKSTSEMKDITDVTEEIIDTVARAFNMPGGILRGEVANVSEITKNFLTFCVDPICEMIQTEIVRKRCGARGVQQGTYLRIDTTAVMHKDVFEIAEKIDKLIASGMYCIDELRKKLGDAELNTKWSKKHHMTKNYEELGEMKGGEKDEEQGDEVQV